MSPASKNNLSSDKYETLLESYKKFGSFTYEAFVDQSLSLAETINLCFTETFENE